MRILAVAQRLDLLQPDDEDGRVRVGRAGQPGSSGRPQPSAAMRAGTRRRCGHRMRRCGETPRWPGGAEPLPIDRRARSRRGRLVTRRDVRSQPRRGSCAARTIDGHRCRSPLPGRRRDPVVRLLRRTIEVTTTSSNGSMRGASCSRWPPPRSARIRRGRAGGRLDPAVEHLWEARDRGHVVTADPPSEAPEPCRR